MKAQSNKMEQANIRNFAIISHIDHGKSTLADRMLEITKTVDPRKMRDRFLDKLPMERERGVTIKLQAIRMEYKGYIFNLIDTPGHTDFSYEVSRALAACEGAVLLVDASQGIQAQTLSNAYKALDLNLNLVPVVNKIDLTNARTDEVKNEFINTFGFKGKEIVYTSGKTGEGVEELLDRVVKEISSPKGETNRPLKALVFDSFYSLHQGVIAYIKVVEGVLKKGEKIKFMSSGISGRALEVGVITDNFKPVEVLTAGEVGYVATGFKEISKCRVGDTITSKQKFALEPLPGYKRLKPMVFASLFPTDSDDFQEFKNSLERLALNDSSLECVPESSSALGFGFGVGFLGTFHAEITKERLEREYGQDIIITTPSVKYKFLLKADKPLTDKIKNNELFISSISELPDPSKIQEIQEPWMKVTILTPKEFVSSITQLIQNYRGVLLGVEGLMARLQMICELPLSEIIVRFHDELKSISSGYASYDYEFLEYRRGDIVALNIFVNKEVIVPLSRLVIKSEAEKLGREIVKSLKEVLPKQLFPVPLQAAIGGKIIARETIPALRKDVTAKLYGGDRTRKDKLLKKQKKGKKRLARFGKVEIPKEAFFDILRK